MAGETLKEGDVQMKKEDWTYVPATDEEKIPVHPKVLTFKTSAGKYVSIKDLPEEVLNKAISFIENLSVLEESYRAVILQDGESGYAGFKMDDFCFEWDDYIKQRIMISADNHLVGEILQK